MFFLLGVSNSSVLRRGRNPGNPQFLMGVTLDVLPGIQGHQSFHQCEQGNPPKRNPELHPFGNPRGFFVAEIFSEDDIQGFSR